MVTIQTKKPNKEMQRRGHLGAEAKKMKAAGGSVETENLFDIDGEDTDDYNMDDSSPLPLKDHSIVNMDTDDDDDDDFEYGDESGLMDGVDRPSLGDVCLFERKPSTKAKQSAPKARTQLTQPIPKALNAATKAQDAPMKAVNTIPKALTAATKAQDAPMKAVNTIPKALTAATKAQDAPMKALNAPTKAPDAPSQTPRAIAPRTSVGEKTVPQKTTPSHPLDTDSASASESHTKKRAKVNNLPETITIEYPAAGNPTKAPTDSNLEDYVFKSAMATFKIKLYKTDDRYVEGYWTNFQDYVSQVRKSIRREVFESPLTQEDLDLLDLRSASTLFPTLVNSAGELRTRAEKAQKSPKDMLEGLKEKRKTFQEISAAALKQAGKISDRMMELEEARHAKKGGKLHKVEELCKDELSKKATLATVLEAVPPQLNAAEFQRLSSNLADHVTALAERYRQELLPMVVYIRRMAATLAKSEHNVLQLREYFGRLIRLQDDKAIDYFWPKFMEQLVPDAHLCQCDICLQSMGATKSLTQATKPLTEAPATLETLAFPPENDYRDPATVYKQPNLKLPDMSHHNLTPAMLEDLEYRYKESQYSFKQFNGLLDSAHEQYQCEIKALEDYGNSLHQQDNAATQARIVQAITAANEDSDEDSAEDPTTKRRRLEDELRVKTDAEDAINAFKLEEEKAYASLSALNTRERNKLSLEERRLKIENDCKKYQEDLKWEGKLQQAEDIQGFFFDRIIPDEKVLDDIIQAHKDSGNPEPTPLSREPVLKTHGNKW